MAIQNRAAIFAKMHKVLRKHFEPVTAPERSVFESLAYAALLENSPYEKVDEAFIAVQQAAFDWNEIRVTTITELSETFRALPDPRRSASALKRLLQSIFESRYSFDLEELRKQNLGKTEKELLKLPGASPFVVSYVTQHALGGHSIPVDDAALECLYIAGAIDEKEKEKRTVPGLERAIPKKKGIEFGSLLHHLAAEFAASKYSPHVKDVLVEIDPTAMDRLPKRQRKKTAKKSSPEPKQAKASVAKKKAKPDKSAAVKKDSAIKKKPTTKKKTSSKQLTRRKPR